MVDIERPLRSELAVNIDLNDVRAGVPEADVRKEGHVVGITVSLDCKLRWCRHYEFLAIGRKNPYVRLKLAHTDPVVDNREFQQG